MRLTYTFLIAILLFNGGLIKAQPLSVSITTNEPSIECDSQSGTLWASASGGVAPYSYIWSTGSISYTISNLGAHTYTVIVTDAVSDTSSASFTISELPYIRLNYSYYPPTPGNCDGAFMINPFQPNVFLSSYAPFIPLNSSNFWQPVCHPGPPVVSTVFSDPSNCPSEHNGLSINPSLFYAGPYTVTQLTPTGCSNTNIKILNQYKFDYSAMNSAFPQVFSNWTGFGSYSVASIEDIQGNIIATLNLPPSTTIAAMDSLIIDFGITLQGTYVFKYYDAVFAQTNDTIGLRLTDTLTFSLYDCGTLSGSVFYDENSNCLYDVGSDINLPNSIINIQPINANIYTNQYGQFNAYLPYGNYTASQYNPYGFNQLCPPAPSFNFSLNSTTPNVVIDFADTSSVPPQCDLRVFLQSGLARPGFDYHFSVKVENANLLPVGSTVLTLSIDSSLNFVSASDSGQFSNHEIIWNVPPLNGFKEVTFYAILNIPPTIPIGYIFTSSASVTQLVCDTIPQNNFYPHQRIVTGAYDPNEKSVSPIGVGPQNIIPHDYPLQYTIEFENVGNDTAFRVVIIDTIPPTLDISTIQIENSSHEYFFQVNSPNILRFTFENILLPDSATNNEESKGYITFNINQIPGLTDWTILKNRASIFFDYNIPIITNTVINTVKEGPIALCQNLTTYLDSSGFVTISQQSADDGSYDFYGIQSVSLSDSAFDCSHTGVNMVTLYVTSINGLIDSCQAEVTVLDILAPVITCNDTILEIDASCVVTLSPLDITLSAYDNCNPLQYSLSQSTFDCSNIGLNSVILTITDPSGNSTSCTSQVTIVDVTGLDNISSNSANHLILTPNPTTGIVQLPGFSVNGTVTVFNLSGKEVYNFNKLTQPIIDMSDSPSGSYLVRLINENEVYYSKMILLSP